MSLMTTINKEEIQKFSRIAEEWWDANGKFKPLHVFNPIRIKYIKDKCISHFRLDSNKGQPLSSLEILDIGCGGGLITEPMYRLGAKITGMDSSIKNIMVAKLHAEKNNLKINYINSSPEKNDLKKKLM